MWRSFQKAEHLLKHPEELMHMLGEAMKKAYAKRAILVHLFEDFLTLFRLVKAWVTGEYRNAPRKSIFWAVLAILYFLSPIDLIPDILPGGYLDDIFVINYVIKKIQDDLVAFKSWEKNQKQGPKSPVKS